LTVDGEKIMASKKYIDENTATNIWAKARAERIPIHGSLELTRRCNVRCPYCYLDFAHNTRPEDELSREELFSILDQIVSEGCLSLTFTGGEPLSREDFKPLYLYAIRKGLMVIIFTNGTLIDREMADFFALYPPFYIDITVFGATEETYERVSGIKGTFRQCREAIKLLAERDIPFGLKSVITTLNQQEIGEMKNWAKGLGQEFRFDTMICPQLNGSRSGIKYRLSPEEIVQLDHQDPEKWQEWLDYACRQKTPVHSDRLYSCGGGLTSFHITSSGKLGLCVLDTNHHYDLIEGSFHEGWYSFIPRVRDIRIEKESECSNCRFRDICTICPAWSMIETGSPEKIVDFICQIAHLRGILLKEYRGSKNEEEKKETISQARSKGR